MTQEKIILSADNSQISQFLTCPKSWYLKYINHLGKRGSNVAALDKGTVVHALLDVFYKCRGLGMNVNDSLNTTFKTFDRQMELGKLPEIKNEDTKLIKGRFSLYVTYYLSKDFKPLVINNIPQVEVGFSIPLVDTPTHLFAIEGKIDLITTQEMFVDHKSQERKYDHYQFDTQFLTYAMASGLKLGMVNYFGLQKEFKEGTTFRRMSLCFSHSHLDRWKERLHSLFLQMVGELNNIEEGFEPSTNEKSCSGSWGYPCEFHTICEATDSRIQKMIQISQYEERPRWEPWTIKDLVME
jgi:hypothetical protein